MRRVTRSSWLRLSALVVPLVAGCPGPRNTEDAGDTAVELLIEPHPPRVGPATAVVVLRDRQYQPVTGAAVKLEGNMNHAGMEPVFAEAKESEPGRYTAAMKFTMGGDWFVLIDASLPDGRKLRRKVDVPGVKRGE